PPPPNRHGRPEPQATLFATRPSPLFPRKPAMALRDERKLVVAEQPGPLTPGAPDLCGHAGVDRAVKLIAPLPRSVSGLPALQRRGRVQFGIPAALPTEQRRGAEAVDHLHGAAMAFDSFV